jgi:hypothetical protein
MSYEQGYFPPNGTKYKWHPKALQHYPWISSHPWEVFPARIVMSVDKQIDGFHWCVKVTDFKYKRTRLDGVESIAISACLKAESVADEEQAKLWKPWMAEAFAAGWRP